MRTVRLLAAFLFVAACGGGKPTPGLDTKFADPNDPAYAAQQNGAVDPRISRSAGTAGGVVVLWPRVVPASSDLDSTAQAIQAEIARAVSQARPDAALDVRPSPERTCPQTGCEGVSISAVLLHSGGGCAVALAVSAPGKSEARLSPWIGEVEVKSSVIAYREPPESHLLPSDFARCTEIGSLIPQHAKELEAAIQ